MPLEYSLTEQQATESALSLRPMPLTLSHRQLLAAFLIDIGCAGTARRIRGIIREELCGSVLNVVRLPARAGRDLVPVLICPGPPETNTLGSEARPHPRVYVIHENRELRCWRPDPTESVGPGQLNWQSLNLALSDVSRLQPISDAEWRAFVRAEAPQDVQRIRRCVWDHHVRRLRIKPKHGRDWCLVGHSSRCFEGITDMVVNPLLEEIQLIERRLIKAFMFPLHETLVRPRTPRHRLKHSERCRNRRQAIDSYPFLEDLWYTNTKIESPLANSLISQLDTQEKKQLRRLIDEGIPLSELLCRFLRLDPWMIDHLRRYWSVYLGFDRSWHPDRQWDLGATLALWTPETAPNTLEELQRWHDLSHRFDRSPTPLYRTIQTPISPADRRRLRRLVLHDSDAKTMDTYLDFLYALSHWIAKHRGSNPDDDLPQLLGVKTLDDWWVMARRWHRINAKLQRSSGQVDTAQRAAIHLQWPPLLRSAELIGSFTFESLHTYAGLVAESEQMKNCASTYVIECATGESHMLHMSRDDAPVGTLEVRTAMYSDNRKILLVHAESADHTHLSRDAELALEQFLDACNTGRIAFNPEALLPRSLRMELLAPMLQAQCIDYPTWARAGLRFHYFDLHARVAGPALIDHYRSALELQIGAKDSLYQIALRAVKQCRTLNTGTRDYLERVAGA